MPPPRSDVERLIPHFLTPSSCLPISRSSWFPTFPLFHRFPLFLPPPPVSPVSRSSSFPAFPLSPRLPVSRSCRFSPFSTVSRFSFPLLPFPDLAFFLVSHFPAFPLSHFSTVSHFSALPRSPSSAPTTLPPKQRRSKIDVPPENTAICTAPDVSGRSEKRHCWTAARNPLTMYLF